MTDPLWAINAMTEDEDLQGRIRAAYAQEIQAGAISRDGDPVGWANMHRYDMAVAPDWGKDYAYAVETGVEQPGLDPGVIADARINAQVVAVAGQGSGGDVTS